MLSFRISDWVPAAAAAVAALASLLLVAGRYQDKAARSTDLRRQLRCVAIAWQELWSGVYEKEDADLRAAWGSLVRYWTERYAAARAHQCWEPLN